MNKCKKEKKNVSEGHCLAPMLMSFNYLGKLAQGVKEPALSFTTRVWSPRSTRCKKRINFHMLLSDLHTCVVACAPQTQHINKQMSQRKKMQKALHPSCKASPGHIVLTDFWVLLWLSSWFKVWFWSWNPHGTDHFCGLRTSVPQHRGKAGREQHGVPSKSCFLPPRSEGEWGQQAQPFICWPLRPVAKAEHPRKRSN